MGEGGSLKGGRFLLTNHTIFGWLDCVSMEIFAPFSERTSDFADSPKGSQQKRERFFVHHTLWTRFLFHKIHPRP